MDEMAGPFHSPDPRLVYDFDTSALLELKINSVWCKVDSNAFRSWTGERRLNGKRYLGPHYFFLTNEVSDGPTADDTCGWFALCNNEATTSREHPVIGSVPICEQCNAKVEALA